MRTDTISLRMKSNSMGFAFMGYKIVQTNDHIEIRLRNTEGGYSKWIGKLQPNAQANGEWIYIRHES